MAVDSLGSVGQVSSDMNVGAAQESTLIDNLLAMTTETTHQVDAEIAAHFTQMDATNSTIAELNDFLEVYRTYDPASGKPEPTINGKTASQFAKEHGIEWVSPPPVPKPDKDGKMDPVAWNAYMSGANAAKETNIANIKSKLDTLNNESSMENIYLQEMLTKRDTLYSLCTNMLDSLQRANSAIANNL